MQHVTLKDKPVAMGFKLAVQQIRKSAVVPDGEDPGDYSRWLVDQFGTAFGFGVDTGLDEIAVKMIAVGLTYLKQTHESTD